MPTNDTECQNVVLAVDPGEHCGWSLWSGGEIVGSGIVNGSTAEDPWGLLEEHGPGVVVSEDWHVPRRIRSGHTGLKTYAYRSTLWRALSEARGILHVMVSPQSWRSWANAHLDGDPIPSGQKTAAHHRAIIAKAALVWEDGGGYDRIIQRDECDAILIGAWYIDKAGR